MLKQMNPTVSLDVNDKSYLKDKRLSRGSVPRLTVTLTQSVDGAALQKAADLALERCSQLAVGLAQDDSNYYFIPIDLPAPVYHDNGDTVRQMGTEDTNAYLFCISYDASTIHVDWFHPLTDEPGLIVFLETILYHYEKEIGLPAKNGCPCLGKQEKDSSVESLRALDCVKDVSLNA